jgi:hypothetical protein
MKSMMKLVRSGIFVCAMGAFLVTSTDAVASFVANPGFEDPVTSDGPPFVGSWEAFSGGDGSAAFNSTVNPRSGEQHLELQITETVNTFAGVFQDVDGLTSGEILTWSGYSMDVGVDSGGSEIRIEWRDSVGDTEIARTPNLVPELTDVYTLWSLTDTVPEGANLARVVYAIQSFGAGPNQNIFVDDVSVTVIPEPSTLALLGLGGLAVFLRRSR